MTDTYAAIGHLLAHYCELMDGGDFDGLGALMANAVLCGPDGTPFARGADEVVAYWSRSVRRYDDGATRTRHLTTNVDIDLDEAAGVASARSVYVVFQAVDGFPLQPIISGRYQDKFARTSDGTWQFTERRFFVDLTGDLTHHLVES